MWTKRYRTPMKCLGVHVKVRWWYRHRDIMTRADDIMQFWRPMAWHVESDGGNSRDADSRVCRDIQRCDEDCILSAIYFELKVLLLTTQFHRLYGIEVGTSWNCLPQSKLRSVSHKSRSTSPKTKSDNEEILGYFFLKISTWGCGHRQNQSPTSISNSSGISNYDFDVWFWLYKVVRYDIFGLFVRLQANLILMTDFDFTRCSITTRRAIGRLRDFK